MSGRRFDRNELLVEGAEDRLLLPFFLDRFLIWGNRKDEFPVNVADTGGVEKLLSRRELGIRLKTPGLAAVGLVVDANDDFPARWRRVRQLCLAFADSAPEEMPPAGLVLPTRLGPRLGAWIMPDNRSHGMLETFLAHCVPAARQDLWAHAGEATVAARGRGAPYKPPHADKARMHAFLAWQDPPGPSLHLAILQSALQPEGPIALAFVEWFVKLFDVGDLRRGGRAPAPATP